MKAVVGLASQLELSKCDAKFGQRLILVGGPTTCIPPTSSIFSAHHTSYNLDRYHQTLLQVSASTKVLMKSKPQQWSMGLLFLPPMPLCERDSPRQEVQFNSSDVSDGFDGNLDITFIVVLSFRPKSFSQVPCGAWDSTKRALLSVGL